MLVRKCRIVTALNLTANLRLNLGSYVLKTRNVAVNLPLNLFTRYEGTLYLNFANVCRIGLLKISPLSKFRYFFLPVANLIQAMVSKGES